MSFDPTSYHSPLNPPYITLAQNHDDNVKACISCLKGGDNAQSYNVRVRRNAALGLATMCPDETAIPALEDAIKKEDDKAAQRLALYAIHKIGGDKSTDALVALAENKTSFSRDMLFDVVAYLGERTLNPIAMQCLGNLSNHRDSNVRHAALQHIAHACEYQLDTLPSDILPNIIHAAVFSDRESRLVAIHILRHSATPDSIRALGNCCVVNDKTINAAAVDSLAYIRTDEAEAQLAMLLESERLSLCVPAAVALASNSDERALPILFQVLRNTKPHSVETLQNTAYALAQFRRPGEDKPPADTCVAIATLLKHSNNAVRAVAIDALDKTNDPAALPYIASALSKIGGNVSYKAALVLDQKARKIIVSNLPLSEKTQQLRTILASAPHSERDTSMGNAICNSGVQSGSCNAKPEEDALLGYLQELSNAPIDQHLVLPTHEASVLKTNAEALIEYNLKVRGAHAPDVEPNTFLRAAASTNVPGGAADTYLRASSSSSSEQGRS